VADISPLIAELRQRARITARLGAQEWEAALKRTSPVGETGNLRRNTTVKDFETARGFVQEAKVDTDYAEYVRSGTRPHLIWSHQDHHLLRFKSGGEIVYRFADKTRPFHHPGIVNPNPWFDVALRTQITRNRRIWEAVNL
jgi:pterin-4a-carbinolamine dehydratase